MVFLKNRTKDEEGTSSVVKTKEKIKKKNDDIDCKIDGFGAMN